MIKITYHALFLFVVLSLPTYFSCDSLKEKDRNLQMHIKIKEFIKLNCFAQI